MTLPLCGSRCNHRRPRAAAVAAALPHPHRHSVECGAWTATDAAAAAAGAVVQPAHTPAHTHCTGDHRIPAAPQRGVSVPTAVRPAAVWLSAAASANSVAAELPCRLHPPSVLPHPAPWRWTLLQVAVVARQLLLPPQCLDYRCQGWCPCLHQPLRPVAARRRCWELVAWGHRHHGCRAPAAPSAWKVAVAAVAAVAVWRHWRVHHLAAHVRW